MRKFLFGCFFALLLAVSSASFGQGHGTAMLILEQPESPAVLVGTYHTTKDLLQSAKLKNVSEHPVVRYRIGWVVVYPSGNKVGLGLPIDTPAGIKPGETADVPAQAVSPDFGREGASAVVFFVTDVCTAAGNAWKPELEKIEQKAREMDKSILAPSH